MKTSILLNLIQAFPNLRSLTMKFDLLMPDVFITDLNTTIQYIKQKYSNFSTDVLYHTLEDVRCTMCETIFTAKNQRLHTSS